MAVLQVVPAPLRWEAAASWGYAAAALPAVVHLFWQRSLRQQPPWRRPPLGGGGAVASADVAAVSGYVVISSRRKKPKTVQAFYELELVLVPVRTGICVVRQTKVVSHASVVCNRLGSR